MTEIRLTNSLTRRKEVLAPLDPGNVRMYVCGPTVYDRAHLGNARPVIVFDVLYRLLRHVYGAEHVTYVRNITDVDDKIIARAAERGIPIDDLTRQTADWFHEDMAALGALPPTHEPRATQHIAHMVAMIETLIERGHAYAAEGHVLFSVASDPDYGALSGRSVEDMIAGARVEVAPYKRDPMDFVLWKPSAEDQPGWESPWGRGRPGWHIECSAMARDLLGPAFDIHGGGSDLMFPHHENEIAQSNCAGDRFATIWLHNEMLQVEGRKMSKSLGNFFTVRDLLEGKSGQAWPGEVIRFVLLQTHYRSPMDWTEKKATEARDTLWQWYLLLYEERFDAGFREVMKETGEWEPDAELVAALADDLNTAKALSRLHAVTKEPGGLGPFAASLELVGLLPEADAEAMLARIGVHMDYRKSGPVHDRIKALLDDRQAAREARDFVRADALRDGIAAAGVVVKDTPDGATWELTPDFDPAKLEALR